MTVKGKNKPDVMAGRWIKKGIKRAVIKSGLKDRATRRARGDLSKKLGKTARKQKELDDLVALKKHRAQEVEKLKRYRQRKLEEETKHLPNKKRKRIKNIKRMR